MSRYAGDVVIRNCDPARASPCVTHLHPPSAYRAGEELGGADAGVTTTLAPELLDGQVTPTMPDMPRAAPVPIAIPIEDKYGVSGLEREGVRGRGRQLLGTRKILRAHVAKTVAKQHDPRSLHAHLASGYVQGITASQREKRWRPKVSGRSDGN